MKKRKIFLDVGGHLGQTVLAVLDPIYSFDLIYSFEPSAQCAETIKRIKDSRIRVVDAGLLNRDCSSELYGPGGLGASIYADAPRTDTGLVVEKCRFLNASRWVSENLTTDDEIWVKLNCEGSECDIVDNLLDSGMYNWIHKILIDFDARKIPSQRHRVSLVIQRLREGGYDNFSFPEDVMYHQGTHFGGIRNWLNRSGCRAMRSQLVAKSFIYHLTNIFSGQHHGFYKLKIINRTPKLVVNFYYTYIKPVGKNT
jgi:FkbM family methyltransferase